MADARKGEAAPPTGEESAVLQRSQPRRALAGSAGSPGSPGGPPASGISDAADRLWEKWAQAILSVELAPGQWVQLTGPDASRGLPTPGPLHVLTAWDPGGSPTEPSSNEAAHRRLVAELRRSGARWWPSEGRDRSGPYRDRGVAISGMERGRALRLADRFGQVAIYELSDESTTILACRSDRALRVDRLA